MSRTLHAVSAVVVAAFCAGMPWPRTAEGIVIGGATTASAQAAARDATAVLRETRAALGGDAALDAVKAFTVSGTAARTADGFTKTLSLDLSVLLPDHYLNVRHDRDLAGPLEIDITYFAGFRGDTLIRRTDSSIPFPTDPWPQVPAEIARRERTMLQAQRQEFARLALVLFGRSFPSYDLQFGYVGTESADGRVVDMVDASSADGYRMRLLVDAATHLPSAVIYHAPREVTVAVQSTVTTKGDRVVSQSSPGAVPAVDPNGLPLVEHRVVPSDFKTQDGLTWPRRLTDTVSPREFSRIDFGKFRLNPKLDPKRFDVGR
jgi:hypothetical protein